jgi:hypothetical protein
MLTNAQERAKKGFQDLRGFQRRASGLSLERVERVQTLPIQPAEPAAENLA